MRVDKALIEGTRKAIADALSDTPAILQTLFVRKDFASVGHNIDLMARSLLQRGMIASRVDGDHRAAIDDFKLATDLTLEFEKAIAGVHEADPSAKANYLDIASFEIPLFLCLLAFDIDRAMAVARLSRDAAVMKREDPIKALVTKLLAAFVLDDRDAFCAIKNEYDAAKKTQWWQYFVIYGDMYESVVLRNQERYDELAVAAQTAFLAHAKDRKFGTLRPEYGGGSENAVSLDFYAVGIAVIALHRGMQVRAFSDVVPRELFVAGGLV